jgi:hypothetical protein
MLEAITVEGIDDELADLLEQRADCEGVHKSGIVRRALRAYLG